MPKRSQVEGYQVMFMLKVTGHWAPYTSAKRPLDLAMARAYRAHLERSRTAGQILDLATGRVVEEWE